MTDNIENKDNNTEIEINNTVSEKQEQTVQSEFKTAGTSDLNQHSEQPSNSTNENSQADSEKTEQNDVNTASDNNDSEESVQDKQKYNPNADLEFPKEIRINPEAQKEQDKLFVKLNDEYKSIESRTADSDEDFKSIRKNLVDLKEKAEALFLVAKEEKETFINTIQDYFKTINERMEEKQKQRDELREKVYLENKDKIDAAIEKAKNEENFNNGRKILIDLQAEMKKMDLPRNRKAEIQAIVQEVFDGINKRQDEYRANFEKEAAEHYAKLKPEIIAIRDESLKSTNFNDTRKKLIETQNLIKDAKLTRQQKDELFQYIRTAFDSINEKQDAEREEFNKESQTNYDKLKVVVQEAIDHAVNPDNYLTARQKLIDAQNEIKKYKLKLSHKNDLFGAIRTVFSKLNETSEVDIVDAESLELYEKLKTKVNEAAMNVRYSNNLNEIRNGLIAVRDEIKLTKLSSKHRKELNLSVRKAFTEYDKKKDEYFKNKKKSDKKRAGNTIQKLNNEISEIKERITQLNKDIDLEKSKIEHLAGEEEKVEINKTIDEKENQIKELSAELETKQSKVADLSTED